MSQSVTPATLDARQFRDTLGHYAAGITIVSGHEGGEPIGFTCQSFYSVSIEPPLVSFSVMKDSTTYPRIAADGKFAVNVLARDQLHISNQFARKGTDKWVGIQWLPAESGNPIIADTLMWVDCEIWSEYEAGDHLIVIGRVVAMSSPEWHRDEPLLYFKGAYRHLREVGGNC
ncbi:flavin reductase family protein [Microbacterium sp.]|uniref:flavin reductase family protein n=1 Tax=Microbacterium sp. TaxID=51671 RepID=UPI003C23BC95